MKDFKWNDYIVQTYPEPQGKLTRVHNLGDPEKMYVDEIGNVFDVSFRSGGRYYRCSTYKVDGYELKVKHLPILDNTNIIILK